MSVNQFTKTAFLKWCEEQPPEKAYNFWSTTECACGKYAASLGLTYDQLPDRFRTDMENNFAANFETFGGLVRAIKRSEHAWQYGYT